jgi:hypothetical protein
MTPSKRTWREARKSLRFAEDNVEDAIFVIGDNDKQMVTGLSGLLRKIQEELGNLDRRIARVPNSGEARP